MSRIKIILLFITLSVVSSFTVSSRWSSSLSSHRSIAASTSLRMSSSGPMTPEKSNFLNLQSALNIKEKFGSPLYVYDEASLRSQGSKALAFPNAYGLRVRYAMKASPNAAILKIFQDMGICFDASSGYEVERAVKAGIAASDISLSSQELPQNFKDLIKMGMEFNACSLNQLETFGKLFPGGSCGLRFNPGKGSGGTGKVKPFDRP